MDVLMREAKPRNPDAYLCTGYQVQEEEAYIVKFEAQAFADTVHHILIYGCEDGAFSSENFWSCPAMCKGGRQQIMFAWAKNAPPTQLPDGVGMRIGKRASISTIVMQIHYAKAFEDADTPDKSGIRLHLSREEQRYVAGVYLLMSYNFHVPPKQPKYHVDISCTFNKDYTMVPFAYRTHSHGLGSVITGYQHNTTGYHMIGKGNPQWPQAFYPTNSSSSVEVKPGDHLVARCTYNSMDMKHTVKVGSTGADEMCNFYMMFYTNSSVADPTGQCGGVESREMVDGLPEGSDVTLPPDPLLEAQAHGHHHHHHNMMTGGLPTSLSEESDAGTAGSGGGDDHTHDDHTAEPLTGNLEYDSDWPKDDLDIGQVGGVATDSQGHVYIFHRGNRIWEQSSFDMDDNFQQKDQPILQDTVLIVSPEGHLIRKFGAGRHFMPHGITVDHDGNMWLTDVALHQVFRIPAGGTVANLMLGERFTHGDDDDHFCKPTDVAVITSGEFFVSDGYCNSRILKFSKEGRLLKQWGHFGSGQAGPGQFNVPHGLTVAPSLQLLCVADRENGRVQCFSLQGDFRFLVQHAQFGPALYALDYCPQHGGLLFAVNGGRNRDIKGFTFSLSNQTLLETWNMPPPQGLTSPHDVAVDAGGGAVYVGELNPPAVRKFVRHVDNDATSTSTTTSTSTSTTTTTSSRTTNPSNVLDESVHQTDPGSMEGESDAPEGGGGEAGAPEGEGATETRVKEDQVTRFLPAMLVGPLVAIPMLAVMLFFITRRCKETGGCCSKSNGSNKGFDRLLQNVSEDSDSENEMFMQPTAQRKTPFN